MKKRLRKKLHKGEFKEMGFYVRFRLPQDIGEEDLDNFLDQFFKEALESRGLGFGGSGYHEWDGFVAVDGRGSVTEEQRQEVENWFRNHPRVLEYEVSDLRDAWYDNRGWPPASEPVGGDAPSGEGMEPA